MLALTFSANDGKSVRTLIQGPRPAQANLQLVTVKRGDCVYSRIPDLVPPGLIAESSARGPKKLRANHNL